MTIIMVLPIKFIYTLKIQMKQNINILLTNLKKIGLKNLGDPKGFC